jgi:DNA adenine methylase
MKQKAKPIVPWMGGKRRLAKHILPLLPEHTAYVEVFAGGAGLLFNKPESKVEVLNDINGDLVTLYRVVKHHLEEFIRQYKWALVSRQEFLIAQDTPPDVLTDIQRAARFYYLQKLSFGAKPTGQTFGTAATAPPKLNLLRIEEDLSAAHLRLARVYIERLDWAECVLKYDRPDTVLYLDPPYWNTAGYGVEFGLEQYQRMAELARQVDGSMLISVNDHPDMRRAFKGLRTRRLKIDYTVGGNDKGKDRTELLIQNW